MKKKNNHNLNCKICDKEIIPNYIKTRSSKLQLLYRCEECQFEFFNNDPIVSITKGDFEKIRLGNAGIPISEEKEDFLNGYKQSQELIKKHINEKMKGQKILEVGCSLGYFLKSVKDTNFDIDCTGVEINTSRSNYVNKKLGIECFENINNPKLQEKRFNKIFLFYSIEYIVKPKSFLVNLIKLLEPKGKIIIYTPNLNDALKEIWINSSYKEFFYEEQSINYFSIKSIQKLIDRVKDENINYKIETKQDYSLFNHINWYLNNKPMKTGKVGGDYLTSGIVNTLSKNRIAKELSELIIKFNESYKNIIEESNFGNIIIAIIYKV